MDQIKSAVLTINRITLLNILLTIRYALFRDRLDRNLQAERSPLTPHQTPGTLQEVEKLPNGARFKFQRTVLEVVFLSPDFARISWGSEESPIHYALKEIEWPTVDSTIDQDISGWDLKCDTFSIHISEGGKLTYRDFNDHILRVEYPPIRKDEGWFHITQMEPDLHVYGLGEKAASLNLRGGKFQMWNTDPRGGYSPGRDPLYLNIPVYLGIHGKGSYLIFYENPSRSTISFQDLDPDFIEEADIPLDISDHVSVVHFERGLLTYYFFPGPPDHVIEAYTQLTGRPVLPPRWALGYHQSRWGYKSESEISSIVQGFSDYDLPLSVIHLDIDYMDGYRVFTVDTQRFPDLAGLSSKLLEKGIRIVAILDPGVKHDQGYSIFSEGLEKGMFCTLPNGKLLVGLVWPGWSVYPDFTNPLVRKWWGEHYFILFEQGISGVWHDMNEPTSFTAWGDLSLPLCTLHNLEGHHGDHRQAHNLYGLLMNRSGFEAMNELNPDIRPWLLTRSGWAGIGRYSWVWTADIESTWEALQQTIKSIIGLGLSGVPFSGSDIGGFLGNPSPELFIRWFQFAAFTPFFRTHSALGTAPREPWEFGEPALSIIRDTLNLRYKLLPYFYNIAWEASQKGFPVVRPIFWENPDNKELWEVEDQFLLGESLLVAPIIKQGKAYRSVVLPAGKWFDFWSERLFHGPNEIKVPVELNTIPVFVHAGSLVPMVEDGNLLLHLYPPSSDRFESWQYSDAGEGYGDWRMDKFHVSKSDTGLEIQHEYEGDYPFPYKKVIVYLHGFIAEHAWINNSEVACQENLVESNLFNSLRIEGTFL